MEFKTEPPNKDSVNTNTEVISKDKINTVVDFLGKNLNIPTDRLEKARKTKIYMVDRKTFLEVVKKYFSSLGYDTPEELVVDENSRENMELIYGVMGTNIDEVSAKHDEVAKRFNDEYLTNPGISICENKDQSVVYINRDEVDNDQEMNDVLAHELLHAMADETKTESGFSLDGDFHNLNEAMVQLMVVKAKNNEVEWPDLIDKYLAGQIENGHYHKQVSTLLMLLKSTYFGSEGLYGFEDIIQLYFDRECDGIKGTVFKMSLVKKIPVNFGKDGNFREKLIGLFEERLE